MRHPDLPALLVGSAGAQPRTFATDSTVCETVIPPPERVGGLERMAYPELTRRRAAPAEVRHAPPVRSHLR